MSVNYIFTPDMVENLFQTTISSVLSEPVIIEDASGPQPAELYCSIGISSIEPSEHAEETSVFRDNQFLEILANKSYCGLKVSFWGKDAFTRAIALQGHIMNSSRFFDLWQKLGFGGMSPAQSISAAYLGQIQERAVFTINFYAAFVAEYNADYFTKSQWGLNLPEKPYTEELLIPKELPA